MAYNPNNANGQATMANSAPVVVASDQSSIPINDASGSITVDNGNLSSIDSKITTVNTGSVTVVSVAPGTGATNLGKAEDAAHTSGDVGVMALGVRQDADTSPVSADGDYHSLIFNSIGRAKVSALPAMTTATTGNITASGQSVTVDCSRQSGVTMQITGTFSGLNGVFEASIDGGTTYNAIQAVRSNSNTVELTTGVLSANPGYFYRIASFNALLIRFRATAFTSGTAVITFLPTAFASDPAPANQAATVAVSGTTSLTPGVAAANLGKAEDAAHTSGDTGVFALGVRNDNLATTYGNDQDYAPIAVDLNSRVMVAQKTATATLSNVAGSATSVTLLSANSSRIGATITNDSSAVLYIKFGTTASTTSYTVVLAGAASAPFSYYEVPAGYTGRIDGIWASAAGNARVTEMT